LREHREQVEDAAHDLRQQCLRGKLKALSGQDAIPETAWIDLAIGFEADGVPFLRRLSQLARDPAYDNIRFSRAKALDVFKPNETPEELDLRRQLRARRTNEFNRKQICVALGRRRWLRLIEIASEYGRKPESLGEIDDARRTRALDELRHSIMTGEFVDKRGRSRVLNMHPSPVATFRFDRLGATRHRVLERMAEYLWITHQDCVDWFNRKRVNLPLRLRREPSSTARPEAARADIEPAVPPKGSELAKKSDEDKEPNILEIAKTFVKDGIAPNAREHTTLVMSVLKKEWPGNHPKREQVSGLLAIEFKNQRRSRGRTNRRR
jgi:hypothetical protein